MYDGTGRVPRIAHVAMEFDSHLALVRRRAGDRAGAAPRAARPLPDDVVAVAAPPASPTREITVVHRASMVDSPAVRAVVAALRA